VARPKAPNPLDVTEHRCQDCPGCSCPGDDAPQDTCGWDCDCPRYLKPEEQVGGKNADG